MNWLKRAGMILEFISFWLAAPEILGHDRLERLQHTSRSLPIRLSTPLSRAARASAVAIVVWTAMLSLKLFPRADAFPGDLASLGDRGACIRNLGRHLPRVLPASSLGGSH